MSLSVLYLTTICCAKMTPLCPFCVTGIFHIPMNCLGHCLILRKHRALPPSLPTITATFVTQQNNIENRNFVQVRRRINDTLMKTIDLKIMWFETQNLCHWNYFVVHKTTCGQKALCTEIKILHKKKHTINVNFYDIYNAGKILRPN